MATTSLTAPVIGWVLFAGVLHASWNALVVRIGDKLAALTLIGATEVALALGALAFTGLPRPAALGFVVASAVVQVGYNLALVWSYRLGDFGHAYPIARGTSPLLVAVGASLFAREHLHGLQLAGLLVLAGGLMAIVLARGRLRRKDVPATLAALLTGLTIATYSVIDGIGSRRSGAPLAYAALLFIVQGVLVLGAVAALRRRYGSPVTRQQIPIGVLAGALSVAAYAIVLWAQTRGPLALVSALRETSVISGAIIAAVAFRERFGWRRVGPAIAVATGIVLISL
jgi:drug/metabolite transporter (DMT)-like permease